MSVQQAQFFCPQCGVKNFRGNINCKECGANFQTGATPEFLQLPVIRAKQSFTFLPKTPLGWVGLSALSLFALLLVTAYFAKQNEDRKFEERVKRVDALEQKIYYKPEIGMLYTKFVGLCDSADEHRSLKSSRADITVVTYKYNGARAIKDCYGTFTFVDYQLDSISR